MEIATDTITLTENVKTIIRQHVQYKPYYVKPHANTKYSYNIEYKTQSKDKQIKENNTVM